MQKKRIIEIIKIHNEKVQICLSRKKIISREPLSTFTFMKNESKKINKIKQKVSFTKKKQEKVSAQVVILIYNY